MDPSWVIRKDSFFKEKHMENHHRIPSFNTPYDANLVGGWTNPFEKYARQIGNLPQFSGWI